MLYVGENGGLSDNNNTERNILFLQLICGYELYVIDFFVSCYFSLALCNLGHRDYNLAVLCL